MPVRRSLAALALALCLYCSMTHAQEGGGVGKLKLDADLFGTGDMGKPKSATSMSSGVTGAELPPAAPYASGVPTSYGGGGMSYSPSLGGHLRARYNTQSYGQAAGNLDLGTMFMHMDGDRSLFFDGQVTLNDESHVGFNLGLGARALIDMDYSLFGDEQKILGVSIWADGSSTQNDNFYPQLGLSGELLGETWDLRANASFVLENQTLLGETRIADDGISYIGNSLATATLTGRDNAMHLTEIEAARRVANREFWAFAGGYGLYGGDGVDTAGYKLGVRGYATPDLMLQLAVTDDDLFDTNTVFSIAWFIGRTRTNTCFSGNLTDRFREPVLRNDYVAVYQDSVSGSVDELTHDFDGDGTSEAIRVVHVNSNAGVGGDGTAENPLQSLDDVEANSQDGDIILVYSDSTFADETATLQDFQRLLGEGNDLTFSVTTDQFGAVTLPESSTGAQSGVAPIITNTAASAAAVVLADSNEVANFTINGSGTSTSAIVAGTNGAGDPNLHDLTISSFAGDAIVLSPFERVDGSDTTIAFNATLDNITFDSVAGNDITIDATTTADPSAANVTLNETISITNITSTNNGATSLAVSNTHDGGGLTVDNYDWDGGASGVVGMSFTATGGTVDVTNSTLTGGAPNATAFEISSTTGAVAIGDSTSVTNINGDAASIFANEETVDFAATVSNNATTAGGTVSVIDNVGAVTINGDITTQDVVSLNIQNPLANVSVSGNVTSNGATGTAVVINDDVAGDGALVQFSDPTTTVTANDGGTAFNITGVGDDDVTVLAEVDATGGINVTGRTGGTIDFGGGTTLDTGTADAVTLTGIDGATVSFTGLDITTTSGSGFVADSGNISVTGTSNSITTGATTGAALRLDGTAGTITSTSGITFASIDTGAGSADAIFLDNVEGNVTVNGGTLNTAANEAVHINNATGVTLNDVTMNSGGANAVVATYDSDNDNNLTITGADLNGDEVSVLTSTTTAGADTTVTIIDATEGGVFDFDTTGAGNLDAAMTTVTGTGAVTMDVTGAGNGELTMISVNTGQAVTATSSGASTGDLSLSMTNSGNTTQFSSVRVNDQGGGAVDADLNNTDISGTLDFDSDLNGAATLAVTGGSVGGAVTADATNNGDFDVTMNGAGDYQSTVAINADNSGEANITMNGNNTIDGAVTIDTTSNVTDATITIDSAINNTLTVNAGNDESLTFQMSGSQITTGVGGVGFTLDINNSVAAASVTLLNNDYDSGIVLNADNAQAFSLDIDGDTVSTGDNVAAFELNLLNDPSTADIQIADSTYDTDGAVAFDFTNDNGNDVRLWLDNNDFENESATLAAANLTINAGSLDATIGAADSGGSGNSFINNAAGTSQFLLTANAGTSIDIRYDGNSHNGNAGNYEFDNTAGVSFEVFDLPNANGDFQNTGTFVPTPNAGAFTNTNVNPDLPNP